MPPKKPVKPVPEQDKTQFPLSSVMEAKPKLKTKDIFEDSKARGQERMRVSALHKEAYRKKLEERKKNPKPKQRKEKMK